MAVRVALQVAPSGVFWVGVCWFLVFWGLVVLFFFGGLSVAVWMQPV